MFENITSEGTSGHMNWSLHVKGLIYDGAFLVGEGSRIYSYVIAITEFQITDLTSTISYNVRLNKQADRMGVLEYHVAEKKQIFQAKLQGKIKPESFNEYNDPIEDVFLTVHNMTPEQRGYFAQLYNEKYDNV